MQFSRFFTADIALKNLGADQQILGTHRRLR